MQYETILIIDVYDARLRGYKTFFVLISVEHEIYPANKSQVTNNANSFLLNIAEHETSFITSGPGLAGQDGNQIDSTDQQPRERSI